MYMCKAPFLPGFLEHSCFVSSFQVQFLIVPTSTLASVPPRFGQKCCGDLSLSVTVDTHTSMGAGCEGPLPTVP